MKIGSEAYLFCKEIKRSRFFNYWWRAKGLLFISFLTYASAQLLDSNANPDLSSFNSLGTISTQTPLLKCQMPNTDHSQITDLSSSNSLDTISGSSPSEQDSPGTGNLSDSSDSGSLGIVDTTNSLNATVAANLSDSDSLNTNTSNLNVLDSETNVGGIPVRQ